MTQTQIIKHNIEILKKQLREKQWTGDTFSRTFNAGDIAITLNAWLTRRKVFGKYVIEWEFDFTDHVGLARKNVEYHAMTRIPTSHERSIVEWISDGLKNRRTWEVKSWEPVVFTGFDDVEFSDATDNKNEVDERIQVIYEQLSAIANELHALVKPTTTEVAMAHDFYADHSHNELLDELNGDWFLGTINICGNVLDQRELENEDETNEA